MTVTTLDEATVASLAGELDEAEQSGRQIRQFSLRHAAMTVADAHAIQRAWMRVKLAAGRTVVGHKIGLTSRAMQQAVGIDQPDSGTLLDDMVIAQGTDIPRARFIVPRVEVELAFILGRHLEGPGVTIFDVLAATDWVVPALEIIDARIHQIDPQTKAARRVVDTISDNARMPASSWGAAQFAPTRWICAGFRRC